MANQHTTKMMKLSKAVVFTSRLHFATNAGLPSRYASTLAFSFLPGEASHNSTATVQITATQSPPGHPVSALPRREAQLSAVLDDWYLGGVHVSVRDQGIAVGTHNSCRRCKTYSTPCISFWAK